MQLLQDVFIVENLQVLTEGKQNGTMKIRGVFGRCNEKNNNGRIYPTAVLEGQLKKVQPLISERRLCGELDHPQSGEVRLSNASHLITKLNMVGNELIGEAEILKTPAGLTAKALVDGGVRIGISSRGQGTLSEGNDGAKIVNEDYSLITFDLVADPSTRGAFPGLAESTENKFVRESQDKLKKEGVFVTMLQAKLRDTFKVDENEAFLREAEITTSKGKIHKDQSTSRAKKVRDAVQKRTGPASHTTRYGKGGMGKGEENHRFGSVKGAKSVQKVSIKTKPNELSRLKEESYVSIANAIAEAFRASPAKRVKRFGGGTQVTGGKHGKNSGSGKAKGHLAATYNAGAKRGDAKLDQKIFAKSSMKRFTKGPEGKLPESTLNPTGGKAGGSANKFIYHTKKEPAKRVASANKGTTVTGGKHGKMSGGGKKKGFFALANDNPKQGDNQLSPNRNFTKSARKRATGDVKRHTAGPEGKLPESYKTIGNSIAVLLEYNPMQQAPSSRFLSTKAKVGNKAKLKAMDTEHDRSSKKGSPSKFATKRKVGNRAGGRTVGGGDKLGKKKVSEAFSDEVDKASATKLHKNPAAQDTGSALSNFRARSHAKKMELAKAKGAAKGSKILAKADVRAANIRQKAKDRVASRVTKKTNVNAKSSDVQKKLFSK